MFSVRKFCSLLLFFDFSFVNLYRIFSPRCTIYSFSFIPNLFHHLVLTSTQPAWLGSLGAGTLCGRLEQALRSDTYGDFRLGQLTQVNIVAVSG